MVSQVVVSQIVTGALVNAIVATGRRLGAYVSAPHGRRHSEDMSIARWFDTYQLTESFPALPDLSPESAEELGTVLQANDVQAVLHELLAARLTDAPEADVDRVRAVFNLTLSAAGSDVAQLCTALFDYYDGEICALVGRLEGAEPALLGQLREEALTGRMIAILQAIERHTAALTTRPDRQTEGDFLTGYRRHVTEHHGRIDPPDFERRRRVPIADLYVTPSIVHLIEAEPGHSPREVDLWTFDEEIDRTVLLGDPGGGKTTAANVLLHHHARDVRRRVPFLVTLREFAAQDPPERSVVAHIEHKLDAFYQCPAPPGLLTGLLLSGRALVIFDGLDELVDSARRADVTAIVERFATEYPLAQVLVTSRLVGYDQARLDDRQFARYRIGGFADDLVGEYVRKWFTQEEGLDAGEAERCAEAFMDESAAIPDLRSNPLMLALMCILYRGEGSLPRNRAEIYEQCATLLFRKWDARRRIHHDLRASHLLEPAIRHLAHWLFTRDQAQPAVTERELIDETTLFLHERGFESAADAREAATEFVTFCRGRMWVFSDIGTTTTGEALYAFTHRTFMEYFTAAHLAFSCDTPERLARTLAPHLARHEWEVVGELAVQIKDNTSASGAERIYTTLLGERRRRSPSGRSGVLEFLARCLRSVSPTPQTSRKLTDAILDHLFAGHVGDPVRHLPLSWLLASCTTYPDVVNDAIRARAVTMVEADDPTAHLNGLRLAVYLPEGASWASGPNGPILSSNSPLFRFWKARCRENIQTHADAIIAAAEQDGALLFTALEHGLLTVDRVLEMPGGLSSLLQVHPFVIFAGGWESFLLITLSTLTLGRNLAFSTEDSKNEPAQAINDLAAVGRYLLKNPHPPWTYRLSTGWSEFFWGHSTERETSHIALDHISYLGAAVILLITTESMQTKTLSKEGAARLGPLSDLYPYIACRRGFESDQALPDLPILEHFRQTFRDWAYNKINFTHLEQAQWINDSLCRRDSDLGVRIPPKELAIRSFGRLAKGQPSNCPFFARMENARQALRSKISVGPLGSLESRTAIASLRVATSTQAPLPPLWALLRHAARDKSTPVGIIPHLLR